MTNRDDQYTKLKPLMSLTQTMHYFFDKGNFKGSYLASKYVTDRDHIWYLQLTNKEIYGYSVAPKYGFVPRGKV